MRGPETQVGQERLAIGSLPAMTTAAAPSPKRPQEMRLAMDWSLSCQVREQSSTERSSAY